MICPKCDEGKMTRVRFKTTERNAYLCDLCEALWFVGEEIGITTAHTLSAHRGEDVEYSLDENEDKDQEHRSARYVHYK